MGQTFVSRTGRRMPIPTRVAYWAPMRPLAREETNRTRLMGAINYFGRCSFSHAASADERDDFVGAEPSARRQGHRLFRWADYIRGRWESTVTWSAAQLHRPSVFRKGR